MLQEIMRCEFDLFVPPFRGAVHASDQRRTVHASQVAEDKRIAGLGLVSHTLGKS